MRTYYFKYLRLHIAPQTRVNADINSPGFMSLEGIKSFCKKLGFGYTIFYIENGKQIKVEEESLFNKTTL